MAVLVARQVCTHNSPLGRLPWSTPGPFGIFLQQRPLVLGERRLDDIRPALHRELKERKNAVDALRRDLAEERRGPVPRGADDHGGVVGRRREELGEVVFDGQRPRCLIAEERVVLHLEALCGVHFLVDVDELLLREEEVDPPECHERGGAYVEVFGEGDLVDQR